MTQSIRVFHIPYLTPYTRKIASSRIKAATTHEGDGRRSIYWERPFLQTELDAFDVLHIHSLRGGTTQGMRALLEQCASKHKRIVFTAHDLRSLRDKEEIHQEKLRLVCSMADVVIILTQASADALIDLVKDRSLEERLSIIPHGFAIHPHHAYWGHSRPRKKPVQYALYGGFRHNRDILHFAQAWYESLKGSDAQLNVLLQTPTTSQINDPQLEVQDTLAFLRSDTQQMQVTLAPFLSDERIIHYLSHNDVLALPYLWGTHSGQLEMAFDLNLFPLITPVGFFEEQWRLVQPYVQEPYWFNWSASHTGHIQPEIFKEIQAGIHSRSTPLFSEEWKSYRLWEHQEFIQAHYQLYSGASKVQMRSLKYRSYTE